MQHLLNSRNALSGLNLYFFPPDSAGELRYFIGAGRLKMFSAHSVQEFLLSLKFSICYVKREDLIIYFTGRRNKTVVCGDRFKKVNIVHLMAILVAIRISPKYLFSLPLVK